MIDAHHHLWDLSVREQPWLTGDQPWATEEELRPLRRPPRQPPAESEISGMYRELIAGLSGPERDAILSGTAQRIYQPHPA
jgi:predicted TIM-barrel fold metal-dependent hydrolase